MGRFISFCLLLLAVAMLRAPAQPLIGPTPPLPPTQLDYTLPSTDVVVTGTISKVDKGTRNMYPVGIATMQVTRKLKGTVGDTVTFTYPLPLDNNPNAIGFAPGDKRLLLLNYTRDELSLNASIINGQAIGVRDVGEADALAAKIKELTPIEVTLVSIGGPFIFNEPQTVVFKVKNISDGAVKISNPMMTGYFYSTLMEPYVQFTPLTTEDKGDVAPGGPGGPTVNPAGPAAGGGIQYYAAPGAVVWGQVTANGQAPMGGGWRIAPPIQPTDINPKAEQTFTATTRCMKPNSWSLVTPETYLYTVIGVRVRVMVTITDADGKVKSNAAISSPFSVAWAGFPPPKSLQADKPEVK